MRQTRVAFCGLCAAPHQQPQARGRVPQQRLELQREAGEEAGPQGLLGLPSQLLEPQREAGAEARPQGLLGLPSQLLEPQREAGAEAGPQGLLGLPSQQPGLSGPSGLPRPSRGLGSSRKTFRG